MEESGLISKSIHLSVVEVIQDNEYLRCRINPKHEDIEYLHLSDLLLSLAPLQTKEPLRILDFGCGGSPYRPLFPFSEYKRADYVATQDIDYIINDDCKIAEPNQVYDLILSTQVLEHIYNYNDYLKECYRLLKPNGRLVLTTHGSYPDHACPGDYHRWTAEGLRFDLEATGFKTRQVVKLTTGPRAIFYFMGKYLGVLCAKRSTPFGLLLWAMRSLVKRLRPWIHSQCDAHYGSNRVVRDNLQDHHFYVNLFILAQKTG
jgi:SAM-dependent methyltransferase